MSIGIVIMKCCSLEVMALPHHSISRTVISTVRFDIEQRNSMKHKA